MPLTRFTLCCIHHPYRTPESMPGMMPHAPELSLISIWFMTNICCRGGKSREAAHLYMLGPCLTLQNSRELSMGLSSPSQLKLEQWKLLRCLPSS